MMAEPEEITNELRLDMLIPHDYLAAANSETERLILAVNYFHEQLEFAREDLRHAANDNLALQAKVQHTLQELVETKKELKRYTTLKLNQ